MFAGTDPSAGFSRYPFIYALLEFHFVLELDFLDSSATSSLRSPVTLTTSSIWLPQRAQRILFHVWCFNREPDRTLLFVTMLTLLVTGCVSQYVLRDYRHLDHDQRDLGGNPCNLSAALALGACLLLRRSVGVDCLKKTPSQTLSCLRLTMRKRLCFEALSGLQEPVPAEMVDSKIIVEEFLVQGTHPPAHCYSNSFVFSCDIGVPGDFSQGSAVSG